MGQRTFPSQAAFQKYGRKSRREFFLDEMERIVPWSELLSLVRPHYAKAGNGRRPVGLEIMLRVYFVQQWSNLSDPGVEEALYESPVLQRFVGVDRGAAPAQDETTVCRFGHLLEKHDLCGMMLDAVNVHLESKGITIATGTIVDATILHAPSSTKNEKKEREPEMHQTREGNQWYFGLKAHIGVDASKARCIACARWRTATCYLSCCTAKSAGCGAMAATRARPRRSKKLAPKAQDMTCKRTKFKHYVDEFQKKKNNSKSRVRAKVEHAFRILKRIFGFDKVRYRGSRRTVQQMRTITICSRAGVIRRFV